MKVMYTVGLPGSGKSHFVEALAKKEKAIVLSSDAIRYELFGDESKQKKASLVYRTLYERLNRLVDEGHSVIVDATNVERERRMFSLNKLKNAEKICYYFDTPYEVCLERNEKRKRTLAPHVMKKIRRNLEFPLRGEGFDKVEIVHEPSPYKLSKEAFVEVVEKESTYKELFDVLSSIPAFQEIRQFNQENPFHQFPLCQHTYFVYQYVNEYYEGEDKLVMQVAALLHDIEKPFCKTYKPLRDAYGYFGHESVSSQTACHLLVELGFEEEFIHSVLEIIQLHMLISYGGDRGASEIYHLVGGDVLTKLYFFREADRFAK